MIRKNKKSPSCIYIIGGAPAVGKSHVARRISQKYGFDVISTDLVRRVMQVAGNKKRFPVLLSIFNQNPNKYFRSATAKKFISDFIKESNEVFTGIKGVLFENSAVAGKKIILEGSMILPHTVDKIKKMADNVKSVFIVEKTPGKIAENIKKRGLWATEKKAIKKQSALIWELNKKIMIESKKREYPIAEGRPKGSLAKKVEKNWL